MLFTWELCSHQCGMEAGDIQCKITSLLRQELTHTTQKTRIIKLYIYIHIYANKIICERDDFIIIIIKSIPGLPFVTLCQTLVVIIDVH